MKILSLALFAVCLLMNSRTAAAEIHWEDQCPFKKPDHYYGCLRLIPDSNSYGLILLTCQKGIDRNELLLHANFGVGGGVYYRKVGGTWYSQNTSQYNQLNSEIILPTPEGRFTEIEINWKNLRKVKYRVGKSPFCN